MTDRQKPERVHAGLVGSSGGFHTGLRARRGNGGAYDESALRVRNGAVDRGLRRLRKETNGECEQKNDPLHFFSRFAPIIASRAPGRDHGLRIHFVIAPNASVSACFKANSRKRAVGATSRSVSATFVNPMAAGACFSHQ